MGGRHWREIVEHRLRWRAAIGVLLISAICSCHVVGLQPHLACPVCKAVAALAPAPLYSLVMASMSPAESLHGISPELERGMLFCSSVGVVAPFVLWVTALRSPHAKACHYLTLLPGFLMVSACFAIPFCGMRNSLYYWPAYRFALIASGVLQLARTVAQANTLRLANAAAALGLPQLLPVSLAAQCQAHPRFLPGGVSQPEALGFGCVALLTGLLLTPSRRLRLATRMGRFGSPAARVLHLGDGVLLEPDEPKPSTAPPVFKAPGGRQVHPPPRRAGKSFVSSDGGGGGAVESLHETASSKSAHSELERVLRHGQDGANGHVSLHSKAVSFGSFQSSHLRGQAPPSSSFSSSGGRRSTTSEPGTPPPGPPSSASRSVFSDEVAARTAELEQELAGMANDAVLEGLRDDVLEAMEGSSMPSPPPPTREVPSAVGQLDAFAEVTKYWQGAFSEVMREHGSASTRLDYRPVDERDGAGRPDQSEKKRPRSETGEAVAEGRSFLPIGGGSCSSDMTQRSLAFGGYPNPAFGVTPHPNSGSLAKPHPTRPVRGSSLTTAVSSPGKSPPARADEPEAGPDKGITGGNLGETREMQQTIAPDPAPYIPKEAATAPAEARKPFKPTELKRSCAICGTTETPKWRHGNTLCNACGLKHPMEVPPRPNTSGKALLKPAQLRALLSGASSFRPRQTDRQTHA